MSSILREALPILALPHIPSFTVLKLDKEGAFTFYVDKILWSFYPIPLKQFANFLNFVEVWKNKRIKIGRASQGKGDVIREISLKKIVDQGLMRGLWKLLRISFRVWVL